MHAKKPSRFQALVGPGSIAIALLSVATLGVLIIAGETTPSAAVGASNTQASAASAEETASPAKTTTRAKRTARTRPEPMVTSRITDVRPAMTTDSSSTPAALPASRVAGADVVSKAAVQAAEPVTVVGCLERGDETFMLKKTEGTDAPKARSWKSGFLKRSAASIEVVDSANRLRLGSHVGERVSVTGMLVDREMQARSVRRVAAECE